MAAHKAYDVFVSYKHNRDSDRATKVVQRLRDHGLRVWFDIDQLALKEQGPIDKAELVAALTNAVKSSRTSVIFAAAMERVELLPGMTREQALATEHCMIDENTGGLIAWNWQKLEIDASEKFVAVHPNTCAFNTHETLNRQFNSDEAMLEEVERLVLQYLADED